MTGLRAILARWSTSLALVAALAFVAMTAAALHFRGAARTEALGRAADRAGYVAAQAEATRLAAEAIHHQEAVYRMKAAQQDQAHETELAHARAAGAAYAAAHRVQRQAAPGAGSAATAAATGDGASLRAEVPAAGVMVSDADVQACSEVTAYALTLRDWALSLDD
ncbi:MULTISPECIES: hypothetical protein [unclassified Novosphingobium]|uniref:hypothetical protein n=1 Tax=unclassified Novosphingobium TaxID=2644732 RepID=UPI000D2F87EE|nr:MULTISPECIES: hypothetical protein [unclassified Novosphingobium]PTR05521.1 hypothetical protein C8K11_1313 [Novosphingobium sp. GV055]PUA94109.1 hypothetical protein C8K12_1313 [Novosphingobium sp. GV061]PUB11741.1 hypothetical protein C8K14_1313 [Novosphingobium sp. GV079]PUB37123.1 hypothetical protein C8K10_1313 [Novosphingobium sp. GV027]